VIMGLIRASGAAQWTSGMTRTGERATPERSTLGLYPEELVETITISGGRTLTLRPIRAEDDEKLVAFHYRLSADSIYCRYFSFHAELSSDEVYHLTRVDYGTRLALVLEDGDDLVGVARYERYPSTSTAEVAFLVRDDYQHLGLGHHLFASLAAAAWARGVTTFTAETLCRNHDMMSVFHHSGFPLTSSISAGQISVRMSIDPKDAATSTDISHATIRDEPWS
jgi:GNAT superfamily N-acetyltransferase